MIQVPTLIVISHPEVTVDPSVPIPDWGLNDIGRRRAAAFAVAEPLANVSCIWTSAEKKARDTADILAAPKILPVSIDPRLGENDRSTTGFLPPPEFEAAADAFFANPHVSYRGWERAIDAQTRIVSAVRKIVRRHSGGDLAIVTHGGVGTLLWCRLADVPIDRRHDQPGQGYYWRADVTTLQPLHGWRAIG